MLKHTVCKKGLKTNEINRFEAGGGRILKTVQLKPSPKRILAQTLDKEQM
jgi:hypothetical protein